MMEALYVVAKTALERLASVEGFVLAGCLRPEEQARIQFARDVLNVLRQAEAHPDNQNK